jgi:glycerol-3-phosphate dehydrogenase
MAEDCVNQAATLAELPEKACITQHVNIHGFHANSDRFGHLSVYGSDAPAVQELMAADPELAAPLHPALPYTGAEVVIAARQEMAMTIEDVLARRTRALFLNARAAIEMAPRVAELMGRELGKGIEWQARQVAAFRETARGYLL